MAREIFREVDSTIEEMCISTAVHTVSSLEKKEGVSSLGKWKDGTFSFKFISWVELPSHASAISLFFSVYPA